MERNPINRKEHTEGNRKVCYDIANPNERKSFFKVATQETFLSFFPKVVVEAHSHDFYIAVMFHNGKGNVVCDFEEYTIGPNRLFFISPGQLHQCIALEGNLGYCIAFSEDFLLNLSHSVRNIVKHKLFSSENTPFCLISKEGINVLNEDFKRIEEIYDNPVDNIIQRDYLASLLSIYFLDVLRYGIWVEAIDDSLMSSYENLICLEYMELVERKFKEIHYADKMVEYLNISLSTLNKSLRKIYGKTPTMVINDRLVIEAKRMLFEKKEMRIKEISFELGFSDASNFVKFFKKNTGMGPTEFRDKL